MKIIFLILIFFQLNLLAESPNPAQLKLLDKYLVALTNNDISLWKSLILPKSLECENDQNKEIINNFFTKKSLLRKSSGKIFSYSVEPYNKDIFIPGPKSGDNQEIKKANKGIEFLETLSTSTVTPSHFVIIRFGNNGDDKFTDGVHIINDHENWFLTLFCPTEKGIEFHKNRSNKKEVNKHLNNIMAGFNSDYFNK